VAVEIVLRNGNILDTPYVGVHEAIEDFKPGQEGGDGFVKVPQRGGTVEIWVRISSVDVIRDTDPGTG
jgi:hypothetical protein